MEANKTFDVVLSFAGEDREYAEALAYTLGQKNVRVFYDKYEKNTLWGKDLYCYLADLYQNRAHYCVMFLSKNYANKLWTNHERKAAQARAFRENEEYILPVRLDSTEIPGILPTIGYLRWPPENEESISIAIVSKLQGKSEDPLGSNSARFRNEQRATIQSPLHAQSIEFLINEASLIQISKEKVFKRVMLTATVFILCSIIIAVSFYTNIIAISSLLNHPEIIVTIGASLGITWIWNYRYLKIFFAKESIGRLGTYLGGGKFYCRTNDRSYMEYQVTSDCNYPKCDGMVFIRNPPPREQGNYPFIGSCTVDERRHTYEVDVNGIGTPKQFDWRPLENNKA